LSTYWVLSITLCSHVLQIVPIRAKIIDHKLNTERSGQWNRIFKESLPSRRRTFQSWLWKEARNKEAVLWMRIPPAGKTLEETDPETASMV
jgi:hypothetical protein